MAKDKNIIYKSVIRYHAPEYPYRIIVEKRNKEIIICHYSVKDKHITHGIGITKRDLQKILGSL
jgi:hypothetical protein